MTDTDTGADSTQGGSATTTDGDAYKPPATQADLDRIISDRLAREKAKYADYNDLKAKAKEFDQAKEAAMDDREKAVLAARREGETEAMSRANTRLVAAEARALAAAEKFHNTALAVRSIDLSDVTVNDDGEVDANRLKTKLKALAEAEPYMVDTGATGRPKPDPSQGGKPSKTTGLVGLTGAELYDRLHPKTA